MSSKVQFRRGTDAERGTVVLDSGEPGWATDTKELYVGDGVTYGGIQVTGGGAGGAGTLCELSDVNCAGTVNGKALTYQNGTWVAETPAGGGDMSIAQYVTGQGTVYNASRLEGDNLGTVQAHNVDAAKIVGTIGDVHIPDVETLSYAVPFADAQIPTLDATKIISGTFDSAQIPGLPTARITSGTFVADRIPSIENLNGTVPDEKIPDLETLSYGAAFAAAQIPDLAASKITSGTFDDARIPNIGINDLEDVNTAGTVNDKVLTFQSGTWIPAAVAGGGDMSIAQYVTGQGTVYNASRLEGDNLGTVQAHNVDAAKITSGTIGLARIPAVDDARIPNLDTLSYGAAFATAQIPSVGAYKITSGTLAVARHETLDNLNGTVALAQIPTMDDAHIPNVDGLAYGGAFAGAQIPDLAASKITTGTVNANRIPALPTSQITTGTFNLNRIPAVDDARIPNLETLSYGGAFATGQIPNLVASKITSGTLNSDRIPILPTDRYGSAVLLTGAQSIGGTKTFSDIPILPASDPTADNEAARKAYVDSAAAGDIDGGLYSDTYVNVADVDGGTF